MSKTKEFTVSEEGVYCTACHFGPCLLGHLAITQEEPEDYYEFNKTDSDLRIPVECPLP